MKKWLRRTLLAVLAVVVIFIAAAVIFATTFDANARRDDIIALVAEHTGRRLEINGDISLSFFPWLGFSVADMELGNAPGFGEAPFARISRAEARVRLWPLLFGEIEVGEVILDGLELTLTRRADGTANWDDLLAPAPAPGARAGTPAVPAGEAAPPPGALAALSLGGLRLRNTRIQWDDEATGRHLRLTRLDLETGPVETATPFTLQVGASGEYRQSVQDAAETLDFTLDLEARFTLDAENARLQVAGLEADGSLGGSLVPGNETLPVSLRLPAADLDAGGAHYRLEDLALRAAGIELRLQLAARGKAARAALDGRAVVKVADGKTLAGLVGETGLRPAALEGLTLTVPFSGSPAQTIELRDVTLAGPLRGGATLRVETALEAPRVSGTVRIAEFSPRVLLPPLGIALPPTRDTAVLQRLAIQTRLRYAREDGVDTLALDKLVLALDDTEARGNLRMRNPAQPRIRTRLEISRLDLDRYLPPPAPMAPGTPPRTPPGESPATPVEAGTSLAAGLQPLRGLHLDAVLGIGDLRAGGLHLTRLNATLRARGGRMTLRPVTAALYGGHFEGDLLLHVKPDTLAVQLNGDLGGVDTGPLSRDFFQRQWITGRGDVQLALRSTGADIPALEAGLNGKLRLSLKGGQITLLDTGAVAEYAKAKIRKQPLPPEDSLYRPSRYESLTATATIRDGLLTNRDLRVVSPHAHITGKGTVDLPREILDYRLTLVYGSDAGKELEGLPMVVSLTGPLTSPDVRFGWDDLVAAWLRREAKRKLEDRKKAKEEEIREDIRRKAEDFLRGLGR